MLHYLTVYFLIISSQEMDVSELSWNFEALSSNQCGEIIFPMNQHPTGHFSQMRIGLTIRQNNLPLFRSDGNDCLPQIYFLYHHAQPFVSAVTQPPQVPCWVINQVHFKRKQKNHQKNLCYKPFLNMFTTKSWHCVDSLKL